MADEIRRMQDYTASDVNDNIAEVRTARGTFDTLDDRLDNIEGGGPSPSSDTPAMDGTGAAGTANTYARGDHVHPTDTSRQAAIDSSHPIASECVSPMTGYSKSSSSTPGDISTGDTLNAAIGKLEKRTELNENNILSNTLNGGGINKLQVTATTTTVNGIIFTVNADKTITATGSITDNTQNAIFTIGAYTAVSGDVLSEGFVEANSKAYIYARGGSTSLANEPYKAILAGDIGVQRNYACVITANTVGQINITFKPMICNSDSYAKSGVYQPYALSNVELTSETADLIDSTYGTSHNVDLDTLTKGGRYLVNGAESSTSNAPFANWQTVEVYESNLDGYTTLTVQIATELGAGLARKFRRRTYSGGGQYSAWTTWTS